MVALPVVALALANILLPESLKAGWLPNQKNNRLIVFACSTLSPPIVAAKRISGFVARHRKKTDNLRASPDWVPFCMRNQNKSFKTLLCCLFSFLCFQTSPCLAVDIDGYQVTV